ncbi:hypothetical protein GCK72_003347 [Caenorhabditis remanei]|uniref:Uncharacterized protein n=1 Tax=Caenorhabditis remanei TaxID=31234 RepID=A0A6A5HTH5_CAERE|nr:hypothetical protein GCK72_003347 [Caenorhabditis remanei]KAF1771520.1 hypothetical protein GCK72_003347 [Caenorhabditis remanei]
MKFQSIIHYLLLIVVVRNGDAQQPMTGKLSKEENKERLATCGTELIYTFATDINPVQTIPAYWPSWLLPLNNFKNPGWSLGTVISPRHLLAFSEVVMNDAQ